MSEDYLAPEIVTSSETAALESETAVRAEERGLLQRLREWSGSKFVLALLLGAEIAAATREIDGAEIGSAGKDVAERIERAPSPGPSVEQEREIIEMARMNPGNFLLHASEIKDLRILSLAMHEAAKADPNTFLANVDSVSAIAGPDVARSCTELAFLTNPSAATWKESPQVVEFLRTNDRPEIRFVKDIAAYPASRRGRERMASLLDDIESGALTIAQAAELAKDDRALAKRLIEIKARPDHLGDYSVDSALVGFAAKLIGEANALHEERDAKRFRLMEGLSAAELYAAIVYWGSEAYPSTYDGTYSRMLKEMKQTGMTGDQLLREVGNNRSRTFIRASIEHRRLEDFLSMTSAAGQEKTMRSFVERLDGQPGMVEEASMVADALRNIRNPRLQAAMAESLASEYARVSAEHDARGMAAYGILSTVADQNAPWIPSAIRERYRLVETSEVSPDQLRNADGNVVERYFFYADDDGTASFARFLARYKGKPGWKVESHAEYVVVASTGAEHGIVIYANKPAFEVSAEPGHPDAVGLAMATDGMEATVAVHRGHVYHNEATIAHIPSTAKVVVLGSCGGFGSISEILATNPDAHIISTQGTGTMLVNELILSRFERAAMQDATIVWNDFFESASKILPNDADMKLYVPPSKNYAAQFLVSFERATQDYGTEPDQNLPASAE